MTCPYCSRKHDHGPQPGHHVAGCAETEVGIGIAVRDRTFIPRYGYTIHEYRDNNGVNELIVPDNILKTD